jgi:hypothetical protein
MMGYEWELLVCREQVDATKGMFRKKREKLQKFEYKLVQSDSSEPVAPKVLPKVGYCIFFVQTTLRKFSNEAYIYKHSTGTL